MSEPSKDELMDQARAAGVEGRSTMTKAELRRALGQDDRKPLREPNGNWLHDHLLSLTLASFFLVSWVLQTYFQYQDEVNEAVEHGQSVPGFWSGDFWASLLAATFENWQSEFLQLFTFVVLATVLIHRESPQSRDNNDEMATDIKAIKAKLGA